MLAPDQAERAKRKLKRAHGLVREVIGDLAEGAHGDLIGEFSLSEEQGLDQVAAALAVALRQRGPFRVQIVAASERP